MTLGAPGIAGRIADAVLLWRDGLDPERRSRAVHRFGSPERFVWDYRPGPREGLALRDMTEVQRAAALAILDVSLSTRGAEEVRSIVALEPILGEIERRAGRAGPQRDPDLYWFAVFGEPGDGTPWSWRFGGHHVAIQSTIAGGQVIGSAPSFLGANPATVPEGPAAGRRAIDGEETLARSLLASLSAAQRRVAIVDALAPPDILSGNGRRADLRDVLDGIPYEQLDDAQRDGLERLIRHYLDRASPEIAEAEWERIRAADLGTITFAWAGSAEPGDGHYYAIRGPRLLIEYDNTQKRRESHPRGLAGSDQ
jgi:hypothetical protein